MDYFTLMDASHDYLSYVSILDVFSNFFVSRYISTKESICEMREKLILNP